MYIFYLESFTFIWSDKSKVLIYNSLSKEKALIATSHRLSKIVSALLIVDNMYRITMTEEEIDSPDVCEFIRKVREIYAGDILNYSEVKILPVIFPPILNFQKDKYRIKEDDFVFLGDTILKHLQEVNIHVDSECNNNCINCETVYKQHCSCTKSISELTSQEVVEFINKLSFTSIARLNIIGTKMLENNKFEIIKNYCNKLNLKTLFHIHYLNIQENNVAKLKDVDIEVVISFPIQKEAFNKLQLSFIEYGINVSYSFLITSESEYEISEKITHTLKLKNVSTYPIYNGENIDFFKEFVFMTEKDLFDQTLGKRQIFAHQICNENDFGNLTVMPNGQIYANLYHENIGHIKDDLKEVIYKEITENRSWRRVRDMKPCNNCVYQWLCPSPNNYELAIGKPNLCHLQL